MWKSNGHRMKGIEKRYFWSPKTVTLGSALRTMYKFESFTVKSVAFAHCAHWLNSLDTNKFKQENCVGSEKTTAIWVDSKSFPPNGNNYFMTIYQDNLKQVFLLPFAMGKYSRWTRSEQFAISVVHISGIVVRRYRNLWGRREHPLFRSLVSREQAANEKHYA